MALQLKVIVVAEEVVVPLHRLAGTVEVALHNLLRHLAAEAGRADDEALVVFLEVVAVGARTVVIAVHP